jgi:glucosamine--fructose-6-phosphate aminotransferase (isomerizing)
LQGAYAMAVLREADPGPRGRGARRIAAAARPHRRWLLRGFGRLGALLQVTRRIVYLDNGDCAELTRQLPHHDRVDGTPVERPRANRTSLPTPSNSASTGTTCRRRSSSSRWRWPTRSKCSVPRSIQPGLFGAASEEVLKDVRQVLIIACGTSYHAGLVARYWLESIAGIPCSVEVASEYRYRDSVPDPQTLLVTISQSGETADTLAALQHAKSLGMLRTLCICNVPESSLVRENSLRFITRAGPEIGVASTKAFTTQLAALYLLTLVLAKLRGRLDERAEGAELHALRHLPIAVTKILELEPEIRHWSEQFSMKQHALFLGRGRHYPIAMEGALKLKEISYIHAEAYPAGELKHGPLALVDRDMPVIAVAPNDALIEKLKSNLQEVRARGGELYVFADADSEMQESDGIHVLHLPEHYGALSALLHVVPLQLLAYHVALVRGTDVDKPRNLAKSVTVE